MLCIGVLGGNQGEKAIELLLQFYHLYGQKWVCVPSDCTKKTFYQLYQMAQFQHADVFIVPFHENMYQNCCDVGVRFHIFMCLSGENKVLFSSEVLRNCLAERNIIIVNSDDKRLYPVLLSAQSMFITCGMNSGANVTVSSVSDCLDFEQIQCCIQKTIQTLSGIALEPQEFTIKADNKEQSVSGILAAMSAVMVGDMEIAEMIEITKNQTSKEKIFE